jgi:hypothetical protein
MGSTAVGVDDSSEVDVLEGIGLWTRYPSMADTSTTVGSVDWVAAGVVDMPKLA